MLIEAGGPDRNPFIHTSRGAVVGSSSSINGYLSMCVGRGCAQEGAAENDYSRQFNHFFSEFMCRWRASRMAQPVVARTDRSLSRQPLHLKLRSGSNS